jgi:preprotein translocase subunit SecD
MRATFCTALFAFFTFAVLIFGANAEAQRFKVASASLEFDARTNQPVVSFRFAPESARDFARFTEANVGRKVDVRVDGKTLSQPIIREPILGGAGQVPVASVEDGRTLAARLADGSAILEMEISKD